MTQEPNPWLDPPREEEDMSIPEPPLPEEIEGQLEKLAWGAPYV